MPEQEIIEAAKQDKRAFVDLYDLHVEAIYRFMLSRVADTALAEDLTSETFSKALEHIDAYKWTGKPFRAWLYRIALNEMNTHFRKRKKERELIQREWNEITDKFDQADFEAKEKEEIQFERDQYKRLNEALEQMKPAEKDILSLRYFEDLSYKEIADVLHINVNHVGVKMNRAMKRLSQLCNTLAP